MATATVLPLNGPMGPKFSLPGLNGHTDATSSQDASRERVQIINDEKQFT